MASIIPPVDGNLKQRALAFLSVAFIANAATQMGMKWKDTPLALPRLVVWFARQILEGNLSMPRLARRAGSIFTPEAYCIARMKLPEKLLRALLEQICQLLADPLSAGATSLWKGHRVWHMDGTGISMPDTPALQKHFGQSGQQKPGCGFPVAHVLCLFDVASGLVRDAIVSPLRTHDMADADKLHKYLNKGDILIADRAFESFVHLALLLAAGVHAILPAHQGRDVDFSRKRRRRTRNKKCSGRKRARSGDKPPLYDREVLRKCGSCDQIVRWRRPVNKPKWMKQEAFDALPQTIEVRELRRLAKFPDGRKRQITLITTLTDEKRYPPADLVEVLKGRWQVEVNLRHLKTTMGMEVLRSQTVAGVKKELWMFLIVYNAVRLVMLEAAAKQAVEVARISFADALYWVRHGDLSGPLPKLEVVPLRPNRVEPRVRKRRNDRFPLMTTPRHILRRALRNKGATR